MRFALLVFPVPLVSTSPVLAQSADRLEPLPALPATPEPAPTPAAPPAPGEATFVAPPSIAKGGQADAPTPATTAAPPCLCARYERHGFYLRYVGGYGYFSIWGDGPTGSASISGGALTGSIAVGGTIAKGLAVAGAFRAWSTSGTFDGGPAISVTTSRSLNGAITTTSHGLTGARATSFEIGALVDWYPDPAGGWHAGASIGVGGVDVTDDAGDEMSSTALGGSLFGGYQWWLGPAWSLGVEVVMSGATKGSLTDSNQNDSNYRLMPLAIGIETPFIYY
jgi:hypothetical protein